MPPSAFLSWVQETTFAGVPLWSLLIAVLAGVATYLGILLALSLLTGRARAWASQSHSGVARAMVDVLEGTSRFLMLVAALLVGASFLDLPGRWENRLSQLWFVAVALQMGLWGMRAIGIGVRHYLAQHASSGMTQVSASATLMSWGLRTLLWSVVLLAGREPSRASPRAVPATEILATAASRDVVLLGEQHDDADHHRQRERSKAEGARRARH